MQDRLQGTSGLGICVKPYTYRARDNALASRSANTWSRHIKVSLLCVCFTRTRAMQHEYSPFPGPPLLEEILPYIHMGCAWPYPTGAQASSPDLEPVPPPPPWPPPPPPVQDDGTCEKLLTDAADQLRLAIQARQLHGQSCEDDIILISSVTFASHAIDMITAGLPEHRLLVPNADRVHQLHSVQELEFMTALPQMLEPLVVPHTATLLDAIHGLARKAHESRVTTAEDHWTAVHPPNATEAARSLCNVQVTPPHTGAFTNRKEDARSPAQRTVQLLHSTSLSRSMPRFPRSWTNQSASQTRA